MSKEVIFFDNNATTKLAQQALNLMHEVYQVPLNSSSQHQLGQMAQKYVFFAKEDINSLLNSQNYQIIFNSGATESNNMALNAFDNHFIMISSIEHSSVFEAAKQHDHNLIHVDDNGLIDLDHLQQLINKNSHKDFIVSIMLANNETGVIQDIKKIAQIVLQNRGLLHCDITQAVGKIKIDLEDLNIDLASMSAHKINGPQGIGALLVRNGIDINPLMFGGLQEDGKRPGTSNIAGIAGFGESCKLKKEQLEKYQTQVSELRDYLEDKLVEIAGEAVTIFSKNVKRLPNTSFFATKNLDSQTLLMNLDLKNIIVSIGSACSAGVAKSSRTLKAMSFSNKTAKEAIRVSLGQDNSKAEIDQFLKIWQELFNKNK